MHLNVLTDPQARKISYLRVSVTERCNLRCSYCMPEAGITLQPKCDILSFEEIVRVVRALQAVGIDRVRLTGGEPTVRRDIVTLVADLARLGLRDLSMTTNGTHLRTLAAPLRRAGLHRLNISLDTLREDRFRAIARRGDLSTVLAGIEAARDAGFVGTKLNTVVMGDVNADELPDLCEFAWQRNLLPRFIELMPLSEGRLFGDGRFVSAQEIRNRLSARFGSLAPASETGGGPSRSLAVTSGPHRGRQFGIISAVSEPFCDTCNRIRLDASGQLHTCLAYDDQTSLRSLLRAGADDHALANAIRNAVSAKRPGHEFTPCGAGGPRKHMIAIGG